MPEKFQKRQIAYKVRIADILNGAYVKEEGWTPNYIQTADGKQISRVNILGTILSIEEDVNFQSVVIDDGSGKIPIRTFEKTGMLNNFEVGDIILVIGRPREYAGQRYILIELIKKIKDPLWLKLRGLELSSMPKQIQEQPKQEKRETAVEEIIIDNSSDKILEFIKNNDKGGGISYEEILNIAKDEKLIDNLLKEGEIFEIKPGYLKILE